jgi:glycolate oxidase iron-sulfur subunit
MTAPTQGDGPAQPPQQRGADSGDAVARALDPGGELRSAASDCVHCGFCLPACPTYQLWGEEMDSPRGRIHLITQLLDGSPGTAAAGLHLDRCLGCMACVTACRPASTTSLITPPGPGRGLRPPRPTPRPGRPGHPARSRRDRATGAAIFATFPYRGGCGVLAPLRAAQRPGWQGGWPAARWRPADGASRGAAGGAPGPGPARQ